MLWCQNAILFSCSRLYRSSEYCLPCTGKYWGEYRCNCQCLYFFFNFSAENGSQVRFQCMCACSPVHVWMKIASDQPVNHHHHLYSYYINDFHYNMAYNSFLFRTWGTWPCYFPAFQSRLRSEISQPWQFAETFKCLIFNLPDFSVSIFSDFIDMTMASWVWWPIERTAVEDLIT